MSRHAPDAILTTLADSKLQHVVYLTTGRKADHRREATTPDKLPDYQELRERARRLKQHTVENLDYYLAELTEKIEARGGKVFWAQTAADAVGYVARLALERQASVMVKSKSMTTEEVDFNEKLEAEGIHPVETDLGEYIVQLAGQKPYHIVMPALHMDRYDVASIFEQHLGLPREEVPERQTMLARRVLREKFLSAGIGISGANFLVAGAGAVVVVENEGNARLSTSAPPVHVAIAGIEKMIPRIEDLAVFLKLLARSATGQALSVYTSILSGPRRAGELDGPEEFHLVLLDNGRTRLLADREKRESLYCIRCGACAGPCPVYRKIGGHNYPGPYSGPIGAIIQPQFQGVLQDPWLPFASSLCGACSEACPVKIDIPKILLALRADTARALAKEGANRTERLVFRLWAWAMRHPRLYEFGGQIMRNLQPLVPGLLKRMPGPARAWLVVRELPDPPPASFRELWRARAKGGAQ